MKRARAFEDVPTSELLDSNIEIDVIDDCIDMLMKRRKVHADWFRRGSCLNSIERHSETPWCPSHEVIKMSKAALCCQKTYDKLEAQQKEIRELQQSRDDQKAKEIEQDARDLAQQRTQSTTTEAKRTITIASDSNGHRRGRPNMLQN
jgi:hypothetical protein